MCGTGIATSTIVTGKVKTWIKENGYESEVRVIQGKLSDEIKRIDDYDIVISTTLVPNSIKDKVITGYNLISGVGVDKIYDEVKEKIEALLAEK